MTIMVRTITTGYCYDYHYQYVHSSPPLGAAARCASPQLGGPPHPRLEPPEAREFETICCVFGGLLQVMIINDKNNDNSNDSNIDDNDNNDKDDNNCQNDTSNEACRVQGLRAR